MVPEVAFNMALLSIFSGHFLAALMGANIAVRKTFYHWSVAFLTVIVHFI